MTIPGRPYSHHELVDMPTCAQEIRIDAARTSGAGLDCLLLLFAEKLSGNQTYGLLENPQKDHPRELCERQRGFLFYHRSGHTYRVHNLHRPCGCQSDLNLHLSKAVKQNQRPSPLCLPSVEFIAQAGSREIQIIRWFSDDYHLDYHMILRWNQMIHCRSSHFSPRFSCGWFPSRWRAAADRAIPGTFVVRKVAVTAEATWSGSSRLELLHILWYMMY